MKDIQLTEKGTVVLKAMVELGLSNESEAVFAKDIAEKSFLLPGSVPGVLTSLGRHGLVGKTDEAPRKYFLTEDGVSFAGNLD